MKALHILAVGFGLLGSLGSSQMAFGADNARLNVIGFTEDGKNFAFEQYGVQDGSGFPYSEIFVIDLVKDTFVAKSPIRVIVEDENAKLNDIRAKALAQLRSGIKLDFADHGHLLVFNPSSELSAKDDVVEFSRFDTVQPFTPFYKLEMMQIEMAGPADCPESDGPYQGFSLQLSTTEPAGLPVTIHKDDRIPASRHCALSNRIAAIVGAENGEGGVAIIQVNSRGFEGTDGRFVAVPVPSWDIAE